MCYGDTALMNQVVISKKIIKAEVEQAMILFTQMLKMEVVQTTPISKPQRMVVMDVCKCIFGTVEAHLHTRLILILIMVLLLTNMVMGGQFV